MTSIALMSAKHSPGVSTLAAVFAALAAERSHALLVEADPSGGDLAARAGLRLDSGLASFAGAARRGATPELLTAHTQRLGSGAEALLAPMSSDHATATLQALGGRLAPALASPGTTTIIDLGRRYGDHPAHEMLDQVHAIVLVIRPELEDVEHARNCLLSLAAHTSRVAIAAMGRRPYPADEIAAALDHPVHPIDHDRHGATVAASGAALDRWLRRTPFVRSARAVFDAVAAADPQTVVEARR